MPPRWATLSSAPCTAAFFLCLTFILSARSHGLGASIQVNSTLLQRSGDSVLVTWSGVQPSPADNITVSANNLTILVFSVQRSPSWPKGSGAITIRLVNIYAPFTIAYSSHSGVLAKSPPISFADPSEPLFPRLSLLGDASNTLVLTWTAAAFTGSERVLLRPAACSDCPLQSFAIMPGGNVTYSRDDMCGGVAKAGGWLEPGWQLSAALHGLQAGVEYEYLFGSPGSMSDVMTLQAPPPPSSRIHAFIFGDMGVAAAPPNGFPASLLTVNSIRSAMASISEHSSVLHIGDISYAMGLQFYWPLFLDQIQPLSARSVYQLSIGNHELCWPGVGYRPPWYCSHPNAADRARLPSLPSSDACCRGDYGADSGGECGVPFLGRFFLPNNRLWYSYNLGPVHFTVTSSEHDYSPGSEQHDWVLADLSQLDRSVTPWIVFTSHRPLYTAACSNLPLQHACQIESPVFQALQAAWEDVLIEHNVTLAATAHIHYYERTCPVAHGVCAGNVSAASSAAALQPQPAPVGAPIYVVVGPAGAPMTPLPAPPHPAWSAALIDVFGYSVVHANATHFHFQFIADGSGDVLDEFLFTQLK